MRLLRLSLLTVFMVATPVANAQQPGSGFNWFGEMSAGLGGDTLATLEFTNGESQDLDAGDGVTLSVGAVQRLSKTLGVRYAIGYKVSFSAADNLDVRKSAIPVDVVPFYQAGKHRFGVGATYHLSPEFRISGVGNASFDDAFGYIVEYGYHIFTLAYTDVDYSVDGIDFDASNIGFRVTLGFGG